MTRLLTVMLMVWTWPVLAQSNRANDVGRLVAELRQGRGLETVATVRSLVHAGPIVIEPMIRILAPSQAGSPAAPVPEPSWTRLACATVLRQFGDDPRARLALVEGLKDTNAQVARACQRALVSILRRDPTLLPDLFPRVTSDYNVEPWRAGVLVLTSLTKVRADRLLAGSLSDADPQMRAAALRAFAAGKWKGFVLTEETRPKAIGLLSDASEVVRRAALKLCDHDTDSTWLPALVRRSFHESVPEIRETVDRVIKSKLDGGWQVVPRSTPRVRHGFGLLVRSLQREVWVGLGALLLWLGLARLIPRRLETAQVSGVHRLIVPGVPLGLLTWVIAHLIGKPWVMELFRRDDVPAVVAGIVVGGLCFGILVVWASRRPEPPAEPADVPVPT